MGNIKWDYGNNRCPSEQAQVPQTVTGTKGSNVHTIEIPNSFRVFHVTNSH